MAGENPYQAPAARLLTEDDFDVERATRGRRFAAFLIDVVVIQGLVFVAMMTEVFIRSSGGEELSAIQERLGNRLLGYAYSSAMLLVYYLTLEGLFQRTLGKLLLGMRVTTVGGHTPELPQILKRTFCRLIPFEPFTNLSVDGGWHDTMSNTTVMRRVR